MQSLKYVKAKIPLLIQIIPTILIPQILLFSFNLKSHSYSKQIYQFLPRSKISILVSTTIANNPNVQRMCNSSISCIISPINQTRHNNFQSPLWFEWHFLDSPLYDSSNFNFQLNSLNIAELPFCNLILWNITLFL